MKKRLRCDKIPFDVALIMIDATSTRVAAIILDVPVKWVDNVLSHHDLPGVVREERGIARRIDDVGLLALALCRLLSTELGIPLARAAVLAGEVVAGRVSSAGRINVAPGLTLQLALDDIERRLKSRAAEAAEAVAHVRRGRPARRPPMQ